MADGLLYLDSSALVKLVLPEPESPALLELLADSPDALSSALAVVEVVRAARRASTEAVAERRAREVMAAVNLIEIDDQVIDLASRLEPTNLRSLDAVHLASALSVGSDLEAMVVYDVDLTEAAKRVGLRVVTPY